MYVAAIEGNEPRKGAAPMGDVMTAASADLAPVAIGEELIERWKAFLDVKPRSAETYTKNVRQFMRYLAARDIKQPTRQDILSYRDELEAEGKKAATINGYIVAVKLFFVWTSVNGIYPDVAAHIKGKKLSHDYKKDPLTVKQARAVLKTCDRATVKGKRDFAILSLMMSTGLRTIEISRANIEDLQTKEIEGKKQPEDITVLYVLGKGRDDRQEFVKLPPPVLDAVRDYLQAVSKGKPLKATAPLFGSTSRNNEGGRMSTRSVSRLVKEHCIEAGINSSRVTAHSLRHTAATLMLRGGTPVSEIQQILRHKDINTTLIYAHMMNRAETKGESTAARAIFGR